MGIGRRCTIFGHRRARCQQEHPYAPAVAALNETLTTTDANGQYTLTNLQPGPTRLVASLGARFIADQETVTVLSGQTVHQDFVLVRKGTTG